MSPAYVHAFSYSPRPGTRAARLKGRPAIDIVRRRNREVRQLGGESARQYRAEHIGRTHEIVVEETNTEGMRGLTDTFVKVLIQDGNPGPGELVMARVKSDRGDSLNVSLLL